MRWEKHEAFEGVKNLRPSGSGIAGRRKRKDKGAALWSRRYRTPLITGSLRPLQFQMPVKACKISLGGSAKTTALSTKSICKKVNRRSFPQDAPAN